MDLNALLWFFHFYPSRQHAIKFYCFHNPFMSIWLRGDEGSELKNFPPLHSTHLRSSLAFFSRFHYAQCILRHASDIKFLGLLSCVGNPRLQLSGMTSWSDVVCQGCCWWCFSLYWLWGGFSRCSHRYLQNSIDRASDSVWVMAAVHVCRCIIIRLLMSCRAQ